MCKHGWHEAASHKKINIENKIRYQDTESVVCKWQCQYEVENNECVISDYEVSQMMLRVWVELRSLMARGKKLLLSLSVFAIMQRKRLPDGSRVNRQTLSIYLSIYLSISNQNLFIVTQSVHKCTNGEILRYKTLCHSSTSNKIWTIYNIHDNQYTHLHNIHIVNCILKRLSIYLCFVC